MDISYLTDLHPSKLEPASPRNANGPKVNEKEQTPGTAFDRLVLEDGQKPMIQALVSQHFRDKQLQTSHTEQVDVVKGKGELYSRSGSSLGEANYPIPG